MRVLTVYEYLLKHHYRSVIQPGEEDWKFGFSCKVSARNAGIKRASASFCHHLQDLKRNVVVAKVRFYLAPLFKRQLLQLISRQDIAVILFGGTIKPSLQKSD